MALPTIKGYQLEDETITRDDVNVSTTGKAVITKIVQVSNTGIKINASSGADAGTGDVSLMVDTDYLDGIYLRSYTLPTASASTLGGIKVGTGLSISSGILSVTAVGGVSSVSNSEGTLTISPTTGAVVATLNLAKANTWTANITAPAFYESSSRKLKKNIKVFRKNATELLKQVKIKEFDFKSTGTHHIGIIAEDTDSIFSTPLHNSFDLASTIAVLIKGFQELEERVNKLERK